MNAIDLLAILVLVLGLFAGFRSGALPQAGGLLGAVAGGGVAIAALPWALDVLSGVDPTTRAIAVLGGLLLCVAIGEAIGSASGRAISLGLGRGFLGAADRAGGALVGLAQAVLVVWLAAGLLADAPIARLSQEARGSAAVRILDAVLPPPIAIAANLRRALDATGLPDVFVGLEPAPASPPPLPADPEVRSIAAAAVGSTVRVASPACGFELTGSGIVVDRGYVVTNAHVVAGTHGSTVTATGGSGANATVVLFDPDLDVALLYAPNLTAGALRFATADPSPGAAGAVLGFPGGGDLRVSAAAVSREVHAVGRDIYDSGEVTRDVLELRATVERGDSGGPFVLADGSVGGLVFAQSRTSADVGYALSPLAVRSRIAGSIGRTGAVNTGPCTT
ncbi:MAG TPA: MarP family serine protease [Candidatus Limnocylindrales bacterium]|nr:MarP family serine protease [Candidatus Limnocylindrales bacterium]